MYDTYVSIDLETTGLNPKRDRIIEIGAIRVEQGQIVEEFSTFVDPGRKLEERITELRESGTKTLRMHLSWMRFSPNYWNLWENYRCWDTEFCLIILF